MTRGQSCLTPVLWSLLGCRQAHFQNHWSLDTPQVLAQDTLAHVLGHGAKCFVAARLRKFMWFLRGWPSNAIRFTSESSAQRRSGATLLKGDYEAWVALGLRKEPPCIIMYERSIFQLVPVQQAVHILLKTDWQVTDRVKAFWAEKMSRIIASQVVEDGVQRQRRQETDRHNKRGRNESAFQVLIQKQVASVVHHYYPLPVEQSDLGLQERGWELDTDIFCMDISQQSLEFQEIASTNSKAPYFSTTAYDYGQVFADLALAKELKLENRYGSLEKLFKLQSLLRGEGFVIRKVVAEGVSCWYLTLGDFCASAAPAWPLIARVVGS